jgi:hypothetical protein
MYWEPDSVDESMALGTEVQTQQEVVGGAILLEDQPIVGGVGLTLRGAAAVHKKYVAE